MRSLRAILAGLALSFGPADPAAAATWFVDNQSGTCSDNSSAGSQAQPYCSILAATNAHHAPGDTILVMPGTYREKITIPASGAPGQPLVFTAQGEGVLIDGSDSYADPAQWTIYAGSVWRAAGVTWQPQQVFVDGARLSPASVAPGVLPAFSFTCVSGSLYVNLGGDNPGVHQTLVGRRNYAFYAGAQSWVNIEGFDIAHTDSRAIFAQYDCTDMVIARNRVSFSNSYGIEVVDGIRVRIEHNVVSDGNYHGIGLTNGSNACVVTDNECFLNWDPTVRRANGIYLYSSSENTLVRNNLHHNQDSGMMLTGGSNDNVSCNNRSWLNGYHGFDHVDAVGNIHTNDVAFGNYRDGFSVEGDSPNTHIHNCIAVDNGLTTDEFDLWVNDLSAVGFVSDYNLFWNSTSQEPFKFIDTKYAGLADYQAASGQDAHSLQTDPRFARAPFGDFSLLADSPAIDAGTSAVPDWPDQDAVGQPRVDQYQVPDRGAGPVTYADIGALEVTQQVSNPDVVMLPTPIGTLGGRPRRGAPILGAAAGATLSFSNGHPNPSRDAIEFTLDLPQDARVRWEVFDLQGRVVWSEERELGAGHARLRWDGSSTGGGRAPSGVYLVRAAINGTVFNRRVVRF